MFVIVRKPVERETARQMRRAGTPYKRIASEFGFHRRACGVDARHRLVRRAACAQPTRSARAAEPGGVRAASGSLVSSLPRSTSAVPRGGSNTSQGWRSAAPTRLHALLGRGRQGPQQRRLLNSDVHMQRLFRRFLHEALGIEAKQMRVRVNVHTGNGSSVPDIERYWLDALALPERAASARPLWTTCRLRAAAEGEASSPTASSPCRQQHPGRPAHLRSDPGVRRLRGAALARLSTAALDWRAG